MGLADDLLAVLNDPTNMWSHALKQLSGDSRRLFLGLALLPKPVSTDVLQIAYTSLEVARNESFLDSLRSIEDSFVEIEKPYGNVRLVHFKNPSLQDFAYTYLDQNTDVLETLLGKPRFFEQIVSVFTLAMARPVWRYNGVGRSKRPDGPKYPDIRRWVDRRVAILIETAVNLLKSDRCEYYRNIDRSRLSQMLEVIAVYGAPSAVFDSRDLRDIALAGLDPADKYEARLTARLLGNPSHRLMLDRIVRDNAASVMRRNVIDKDSWKFEILGKLDTVLELDRQQTWDSWGEDYEDYARQMVDRLSASEDTDESDLYSAITEMTELANMLDVDMGRELAALEAQRAALSSHESDYDETSDDDQSSDEDEEDEEAQLELKRIFDTLL